jgi:hypothetical protein
MQLDLKKVPYIEFLVHYLWMANRNPVLFVVFSRHTRKAFPKHLVVLEIGMVDFDRQMFVLLHLSDSDVFVESASVEK